MMSVTSVNERLFNTSGARTAGSSTSEPSPVPGATSAPTPGSFASPASRSAVTLSGLMLLMRSVSLSRSSNPDAAQHLQTQGVPAIRDLLGRITQERRAAHRVGVPAAFLVTLTLVPMVV